LKIQAVNSKIVRIACARDFHYNKAINLMQTIRRTGVTDEIVIRLNEFITTKLLKGSKKALTGEEAIISSGLVDSFSLVDLALFVEDTFGVLIDDTELNAATFDTTSQLADLIRQRQS
jgi:acyl carrier protein